jgi:hypothetical protein
VESQLVPDNIVVQLLLVDASDDICLHSLSPVGCVQSLKVRQLDVRISQHRLAAVLRGESVMLLSTFDRLPTDWSELCIPRVSTEAWPLASWRVPWRWQETMLAENMLIGWSANTTANAAFP